MLQLNPTIPVIVTSKDNAKGRALFIIDYSAEDDVLWGVAMDENGEIWFVPNYEIRMQKNWSLGRR
jgi:hypothetical protein